MKVVDSGIHPNAISNWCFGMSNATSIDLTKLDTSRCTDFRSLFNGCSSIRELDLSNMDMSNMQDGRSMYMGCSALYKVTIGDTFRYDTTTSDSDAYYYLPIPNPDIIDGADGKWYKEDDGVAYAPQDVPKGGKGTYYASNLMIPNVSLHFVFEDLIDSYIGNIDVTEPEEPETNHDKPASLIKNRVELYILSNFHKYSCSYKIFSVNQNAKNLLLTDSFQASTASSLYGWRCIHGMSIQENISIGSKIYAEVTITDADQNQQMTFYTDNITVTNGMNSAVLKSIRYSKSTQ